MTWKPSSRMTWKPFCLILGFLFFPASPQITRAPSGQSVEIGNDATLQCSGEGFPEPLIIWKYQDQLIEMFNNSKYTLLDDGSLNINGNFIVNMEERERERT